MRVPATIAFLVGAVIADNTVRAADESPEAYEIVAATAVPVLPPPLRAFFQTHVEKVQQRATAGLTPGSASDSLRGKADWHYVMMDVAADGADAAARHRAVQTFPRDRTAARKLFSRHGLRDGGSLPWVIHDRYDGLVRAFQAGEAEAIVREAGVLLHFATDASLPFNTTVNRDGAAMGNLRWPAGAETGVRQIHRTVRHRYHIALVRKLRKRLDYEVRVAPQRYGQVSDPTEAVFDALRRAHAVLDELLAIDAQATADLRITNAGTFTAASNAYYKRLADRAASVMESQLEAAALLSANLIGTAWVEAGSPLPGLWTASTPRAGPSSTPVDEQRGPFVGSRHSTIFHRAACTHAKRIKPANRVYFETARAAEDAGRVPCKSCRPGHS